MVLPIFLILFFGLVSRVEATVYWVWGSGNGGNCASASGNSDPGFYLRQVNDAVDCIGYAHGAGAGHTIRVKPGSYGPITAYFPSGAAGNPFVLEAADAPAGQQVVINTNAYSAWILDQINGGNFSDPLSWFAYQWHVIVRGSSTNKMKFSGANGTQGATLIDIQGGSYWTFEDVEITADGGNVFNMLNLTCQYCNFRRMHIHDTNSLLGVYGIYWGAVRNSILEDSVIESIDAYCIHMYGTGFANGPRDNQIRRNTFRNCGLGHVWNGGQAFHIVIASNALNNYIYNNVIIGSAGANGEPGIGLGGGPQNNLIANNTVYRPGSWCFSEAGYANNNTWRNNLCYQPIGAAFNTSTDVDHEIPVTIRDHNLCPDSTCGATAVISSNPQFVNAAGGNFSLQAGSPAINVGANMTGVLPDPRDASGQPQPQGGAWDIGACEFLPGGPTCPSLAAVIPPKPSATIAISTPVTGPRYISTTQGQSITGVATCPAGSSFGPFTWSNNQGGGATFTGSSAWSFTSTLTPDTINRITVIATCSGADPASAVLDIASSIPALIGAYSLDENSGTAPVDTSGKKNNASFGAGVSYTSAAGTVKYGASALDFNGTTGTMTIPSAVSLALPGGFSFVIQVRPDVLATAQMAVVNQAFNKYLNSWSQVSGCVTGAPLGGFSDATTSHDVCGTGPLSLNQYSCLAVTYNGTELALYVNKTKVNSVAKQYELPSVGTAQPISVGSTPDPFQFFNGQLDEVRLYNYGISAAQVGTDCDTPIGTVVPASPPTGLTIGSFGVSIGDQGISIGLVP